MTKNKLLLVSVLSALAGVSAVAAQPGGPNHFAKLDTNADGVVTTPEFQAGALARFESADTNQDGKVTSDEMKAALAQHKQERFGKRDANGNGSLERSEVPKMPDDVFARLDTDKSGSLSAAELQNAPWGHHGKGELKHMPGDADGDGVVTKSDALAGADQWAKKLDTNGDGKLTPDELSHFGGHHRGGHHGSCAEHSDEK